MEWKDILALVLSGIGTMIVVLQYFKNLNWSLARVEKRRILLEQYGKYMDPLEIAFLEQEVRRMIRSSIIKVRDVSQRRMALFILSRVDSGIPRWRWFHLTPYLQFKYNKFFIRYYGKYFRSRLICKSAAIFYIVFGCWYLWTMSGDPWFLKIMGSVLALLCFVVGFLFWRLLPGKKIIEKYNISFLKIDGSDFPDR